MRSANPALNAKTFEGFPPVPVAGDVMTLQGTVTKTIFLLLVLIGTAWWPWSLFAADPTISLAPYLVVGAGGGLVVALVTVLRQTWAPFTSVVYAALEGLALGSLSALVEARHPGILTHWGADSGVDEHVRHTPVAVRLLEGIRERDLRCSVVVFAAMEDVDQRKRTALGLGAQAYCFTFETLFQTIERILAPGFETG